jgi:outer membrane protein
MKKTILIVLSTFVTLAITKIESKAQQKIGYISANYILDKMPEVKPSEVELNKIKAEYDTLFQTKVKAIQLKVAEYEKSKASLSEIAKADKEKELQGLQSQAEEFRINANASLQKKQSELAQPFLNKINEALRAIVKENGYQFVINIDAAQIPILAYAPEDASVSDLVLKKMGIVPQNPKTEPKAK